MKKYSVSIACIVPLTLLFFGVAFAQPTTLYDILGNDSCLQNYMDSQAEAAVLTDVGGTEDDSTFFLFLESAGYAAQNTFGIYGFTVSDDFSIIIGDTLEVFKGSDSSVTSATLAFDLSSGLATCNGSSAYIGNIFGFYLTTPEGNGYTYYSHNTLNGDGYDHFMIFDTSDNLSPGLLGADIIVAMEDLYRGGDQDFNDMVIGISDVVPAPVSEPITIILIGSGLLGMSIFRRKGH